MSLTIANPPIVKVQRKVHPRPITRLDVRRREKRQVDQHRPPQQIAQGPLNPIILIRPTRPRRNQIMKQIRQRRRKAHARTRTGIADPIAIHRLRQPVRSKLAHQPADGRRHDGRDDEAAGAAKGALGDAGEGAVDVARARLADGF